LKRRRNGSEAWCGPCREVPGHSALGPLDRSCERRAVAKSPLLAETHSCKKYAC
jgi:hypothetical protein